MVKKTLTTIRCVPRYGFEFANVREISIGISPDQDGEEMLQALNAWFEAHGIVDAVYAIDFDDDGCFAIVNDEAYESEWGRPVL